MTLTFAPVDMPKMPDAAREYRNRAVTVWQCPVEPHHVGQTCGEPVFQDSFAFLGSPSRTFPLADCAGWLVVEAAELSADRHDGWRNAPLSCRTDDEGRAVASANTNGGGDGWGDSRHDPPPRGGGSGPVLTNPGAMTFFPGETITSFPVTETGAGTVTVTGLPDGLTWSGGVVSGTVSSSAATRDYTVTVHGGTNTAEFTITVITTWILLADSLTTPRNLNKMGAGPDDSGGWSLRWVRWYYVAGDPGKTIVQAYVDAGFTGGGSHAHGCEVTGKLGTYTSAIVGLKRVSAIIRPNGSHLTTNGGEVLSSDVVVRRLDGDGNPLPRVPAGYTDASSRLWTMGFRGRTRTSWTTVCYNNANGRGELYYMTVPLPPGVS